MVRIYYESLKVLQAIVATTPEKVPVQNDVIVNKFKKLVTDLERNDALFSVEVDIGSKYFKTNFSIDNPEHLKGMKTIFEIQQEQLQVENNSCIPIFIPQVLECHGSVILSSNRSSSAKLYTFKGIYEAKIYVGQCKNCKKKFFPFYEEEQVDGVVTRKFYKPKKYFGATKESIFETKLLHHFTSLSMNGVVEFNNMEYIYNYSLNEDTSEDGQKIKRQNLEQAFFAYHIAQKLPELSLVVERRENRTLDVEKLCSQAYPMMRKVCSDNYLKHECTSDIGCKEKVAIIDGNCKNRRKICAAQKEHITNNVGEVNYYKLCIGNPVTGSSKYCSVHQHLGNKNKKKNPQPTPTQSDLRPVTRALAKKLADGKVVETPLEENKFQGCRKDKNVTKTFDTTWGIINIVRPCSIALGLYECYTSESLSQLSLCLMDKFGEDPSPEELKIVACDVSCGLEPFIRERSKKNEVFNNYSSKIDFVLDKFHAEGHRKPECMVGPAGKYHPDLDKFRKIKGSNLEACEYSFQAINKHKSTTNYMTAARRLVFFLIFQDEQNYRYEKELEEKGKLIEAGYKLGWRKSDYDYKELYKNCVLYTGGNKTHAMPTVILSEEIQNADMDTRENCKPLPK